MGSGCDIRKRNASTLLTALTGRLPSFHGFMGAMTREDGRDPAELIRFGLGCSFAGLVVARSAAQIVLAEFSPRSRPRWVSCTTRCVLASISTMSLAIHRFLDSAEVTVDEIVGTLGAGTAERCAGRRIIAVPTAPGHICVHRLLCGHKPPSIADDGQSIRCPHHSRKTVLGVGIHLIGPPAERHIAGR